MREIGAFEAKNKFSRLLDWVERGRRDHCHAPRQGGRASCSRKAWLQPCRSPCRLAPNPRTRRAIEARRLRLVGMESLPRRRPPVSFLILDSSATLAWIYGDEITEAMRRVFDAMADNGWCRHSGA